MNATEARTLKNPFKCTSCVSLRELRLHIHELAKYCDLLENVRATGGTRANKAAVATVGTSGIAKWLLLASQVDEVSIDTSSFEKAQLYCEPVCALQSSDADHRGSLATRLTRFVFFCNALEEEYRFCEPTYDRLYADKSSAASREARKKSPSMKAGVVLREYEKKLSLPGDFAHLVGNFSKLARVYEDQLSVKLELAITDPLDIRHGLDVVRCLRNHVAHGTFPILENPEYSMAMTPALYRAVLNLLNQAVRVGALYIQLLLVVDNDGFQSFLYDQLCEDEETGHYFSERCTPEYLLSLHREQPFGLNEMAYFDWPNQARGGDEANKG